MDWSAFCHTPAQCHQAPIGLVLDWAIGEFDILADLGPLGVQGSCRFMANALQAWKNQGNLCSVPAEITNAVKQDPFLAGVPSLVTLLPSMNNTYGGREGGSYVRNYNGFVVRLPATCAPSVTAWSHPVSHSSLTTPSLQTKMAHLSRHVDYTGMIALRMREDLTQ